MLADLAFIIFVLVGSAGLKGAFVHCEGFVNHNRDGEPSEEPMQTDSRGAVILNISSETLPATITCSAWKEGYASSTRSLTVDEQHTRFIIRLRPVR